MLNVSVNVSLGVKQILAIKDKDAEYRNLGQPPPTIQPFIVPQIKFVADYYSKLIDVHHNGHGVDHFYFSPASFRFLWQGH